MLVSINVQPSAYDRVHSSMVTPVMLIANIINNEKEKADSFFIVVGLVLIVTFYKGCSLCATKGVIWRSKISTPIRVMKVFSVLTAY